MKYISKLTNRLSIGVASNRFRGHWERLETFNRSGSFVRTYRSYRFITCLEWPVNRPRLGHGEEASVATREANDPVLVHVVLNVCARHRVPESHLQFTKRWTGVHCCSGKHHAIEYQQTQLKNNKDLLFRGEPRKIEHVLESRTVISLILLDRYKHRSLSLQLLCPTYHVGDLWPTVLADPSTAAAAVVIDWHVVSTVEKARAHSSWFIFVLISNGYSRSNDRLIVQHCTSTNRQQVFFIALLARDSG
jgi:hypothetical protein